MDTLVGKLPLAYPSVCTGPPGKDLSAFQHLHMTKICSIRHDVLRRVAVIVFSISAIICEGCNFTPRSFNTALMSHRFRLEDHTCKTTQIQMKVSPNISFIFQHRHTAVASQMNKIYFRDSVEAQ